MKKLFRFLFFLVVVSIFNFSCSSDSPAANVGILKGAITDAVNNTALANVRITVFNAYTNSPVGKTILTANDGTYNITLPQGSYYLKLGKQGYQDIPLQGDSPIAFTVIINKTTVKDYQMNASTVANAGNISGKATTGGQPIAGVMVFASNSTNSYSTLTDIDGNYYIYNLPAGSYTVKGYLANYNSSESDVTVNVSAESFSDITMTSGATGSISGSITFLSTTKADVDVTLTHPVTNEPIPGLVTKSVAGTYSLKQIPDGTYIARGSYNNDGYVVDPDWILKNGEPTVTFAGGSSDTLNIKVVDAVILTSPTNDPTSTRPVEITDTAPVFTWKDYSGTNDYVIEVSDINGNIIWGGFTVNGNVITKNITIPEPQLSIAFNSDGTAKSNLQKGITYRWRIYASKDDDQDPNGWKLISVSEEQLGLFIVK